LAHGPTNGQKLCSFQLRDDHDGSREAKMQAVRVRFIHPHCKIKICHIGIDLEVSGPSVFPTIARISCDLAVILSHAIRLSSIHNDRAHRESAGAARLSSSSRATFCRRHRWSAQNSSTQHRRHRHEAAALAWLSRSRRLLHLTARGEANDFVIGVGFPRFLKVQ
jgi:hypothetical protein